MDNTINCSCGSTFLKKSLNRHLKSKKHTDFLTKELYNSLLEKYIFKCRMLSMSTDEIKESLKQHFLR